MEKLTLKNAVALFEAEFGGLREKDDGEFAWVYEAQLEFVRRLANLQDEREVKIAVVATYIDDWNKKEMTGEEFAYKFFKAFQPEIRQLRKIARELTPHTEEN